MAGKVTLENNTLVIRVPIETPRPSKKGTTLIVASLSTGYIDEITVAGKPIRLCLNAFIKP